MWALLSAGDIPRAIRKLTPALNPATDLGEVSGGSTQIFGHIPERRMKPLSVMTALWAERFGRNPKQCSERSGLQVLYPRLRQPLLDEAIHLTVGTPRVRLPPSGLGMETGARAAAGRCPGRLAGAPRAARGHRSGLQAVALRSSPAAFTRRAP